MGESIEQIRPLTPPKELFYDEKYNVDSDPEFRMKMHRRQQTSINYIAGREKSIASSDDEKGRIDVSQYSDKDRWKPKDLGTKQNQNTTAPYYYDSAGSTQYASGFEKSLPKPRP